MKSHARQREVRQYVGEENRLDRRDPGASIRTRKGRAQGERLHVRVRARYGVLHFEQKCLRTNRTNMEFVQ